MNKKTIKEVFETLTDEQKVTVYATIFRVMEDGGVDIEKKIEEVTKDFSSEQKQLLYIMAEYAKDHL